MIKFSRLFIVFALIFAACSSEDDGTETGGETGGTDSFDRGAMLVNWADNIIVPAYNNMATKTQNVETAATAFTASPNAAGLQQLREAYVDAYKSFQSVSMFQVGKAEEINYRSYINTYPANTSNIDSKISSGSFNLELPSSFAEQGLPALDYLLFGMGTSEETVALYSSNENYRTYLNAVASRMNALTTEVSNSWNGDYRDTFVSNTSSSSTGSVDKFTNDYVMYFEKILRSGKIGFPAGAFTGTASPSNVEARFNSEISRELYLEAVQSFEDFFYGRHFSGNGTGSSYKQYLEYLDSMKDGADLASLIEDQLDAIQSQSSSLETNLKSQVEKDNTKMLEAYDELQKAVILLKVDMMQALSISVDYVDSDGD